MWCVYDASLSGFPPLERFLVHSSILFSSPRPAVRIKPSLTWVRIPAILEQSASIDNGLLILKNADICCRS